MSNALFHPLKAGFEITKLIIFVTLFILHGCQTTQLSLRQGQDTQFHFPYPCDSNEVTIQHGDKVPFYRLTDGKLLSMSQDQVNRFKVQNRTDSGNCYLDLTIRNLMRIDASTYISTVYKDGLLLDELTTRVGLQIEYPPGKASCVEEEDKGGGWVAMECTADVGSISGKIECYQNGEKMPSLTETVETHITLTEIILIRETQPAFCCSSTLHEDKTRCECNDTALNLVDESSNDPCPTTSTMTSKTFDITENQKTNVPISFISTTASNTSNVKNKNYYKNALIILSVLFPAVIIVAMVSIIVHYTRKQKKRSSGNGSQKSLMGNTVQTNGFSEIKTNPHDLENGLISDQV